MRQSLEPLRTDGFTAFCTETFLRGHSMGDSEELGD
jgi:hypothetical protein